MSLKQQDPKRKHFIKHLWICKKYETDVSMTYLRGWEATACSWMLQRLNWCRVRLIDACTRFLSYCSVSVPTMLRPSAPFETSAFIWTLMRLWRHTSPELLRAVLASCISCGASKGRCLIMLLCRLSPVLCWQSLITVIRCWSAFLQSCWTDSRPSLKQQQLSCYEGRSH